MNVGVNFCPFVPSSNVNDSTFIDTNILLTFKNKIHIKDKRTFFTSRYVYITTSFSLSSVIDSSFMVDFIFLIISVGVFTFNTQCWCYKIVFITPTVPILNVIIFCALSFIIFLNQIITFKNICYIQRKHFHL